jgi:transposase-like protein
MVNVPNRRGRSFYTVLGVNLEGKKKMLGLYLNDS